MDYVEIRRSCDNVEEEDYINMEVFKNSPSQTREFEFQMFPNSIDKDTTTSPADELFHNGKLLPLHLSFGTTQMVEKLLQNPNKSVHGTRKNDIFYESFSTPLFTTTTNTPTNNTPFESCNISPVESCQVSRELNPDEYMFEYSADETNVLPADDENSKKSWTRKLKQIKSSSFGLKIKSSRAYLKSFFSKSGCSNEFASKNIDKGPFPIAKEAKKEPFGQIQRGANSSKGIKKENDRDQDIRGRHRRSFSGAIKRFSAKSSSSSFSSSTSGSSSASSSNNSNEFQEMHFFKRSSSAYSDIENSIQAAIAHCKNSQQQFNSRKTIRDIGVCSLSASKVIIEEQERPGLCRG